MVQFDWSLKILRRTLGLPRRAILAWFILLFGMSSYCLSCRTHYLHYQNRVRAQPGSCACFNNLTFVGLVSHNDHVQNTCTNITECESNVETDDCQFAAKVSHCSKIIHGIGLMTPPCTYK